MIVIVSVAISLDGFMDDVSPRRLILSSDEDLAAVQDLRARSDAIVVGAETVRSDDSSLATRTAAGFAIRERLGKPPHPIKVTVTRTGELPPDSRFFRDGDGPKLVFAGVGTPRGLEAGIAPHADVIRSDRTDVSPGFVLSRLEERGASQVLIEGGAETIDLFLRSRSVNKLRVAMAPVILGPSGRARFLDGASAPAGLSLASAESLGGTAVLWFDAAAG